MRLATLLGLVLLCTGAAPATKPSTQPGWMQGERWRAICKQRMMNPGVGHIGSFGEVVAIITVVDERECLVQWDSKHIWVSGVSMAGKVDGDVLELPPVAISGTKTYTAALGIKRTVALAEPVEAFVAKTVQKIGADDLDKILEHAPAALADWQKELNAAEANLSAAMADMEAMKLGTINRRAKDVTRGTVNGKLTYTFPSKEMKERWIKNAEDEEPRYRARVNRLRLILGR